MTKDTYDKTHLITTEEIAEMLGVQWKRHDIAAFLTTFRIKVAGYHSPQKSRRNLYVRKDVERAIGHVKSHEKGK